MSGVKGKSGRRALPKAVLELRGSRWAPDRQDLTIPDPTPPTCPKWLDRRAKGTWNALVHHLHQMRIVGTFDEIALGRYCVLFWRWRDTETRLDAMDDPDSDLYHRRSKLCLDYAERMLRLEIQFGMTPSARASLGLLLVKAASHAEPTDPEKDKRRFFTVG